MMNLVSTQLLLTIFFLTIVYLHIVKKNYAAVAAYAIQSLVIVLLFLNSFQETGKISLLLLAIILLVVKVLVAPFLFSKLHQVQDLRFAGNAYLNTPLTLVIIAILTAIAHSQKFLPLTSVGADNSNLLALALSAMFLSLFLIINRKGARMQIIGILSFENSIVAFAIFAGLEQSFGLQVGIIFDIFVWLVIVTMFMTMIYKHFGSLNVTSMKQLKE